MKSFLAIALFVGVALGSGSSAFFGWTPNHEMVYRFETEVLSGLPEIRRDQYAGMKLTSEVLIQTKSDYSLLVKFVDPKFIHVNGELRMREGRPLIPAPEQEVPEHLRTHLTQPFLVHLKRGIVERFFVEESEPVVVTNIKKSLLAQVQMDLTASRRSELLETNMIPTGSDNEILKGGLEGKTFFTTEETTLNGDCQIDYNMFPMPKYQSKSLEAKWAEEEKELHRMNILKGSKSFGEEVCEGKQYWTIVKTENFDNCRTRPVFLSGKGAKVACDSSKAECQDLYTMTSSTKYTVCGTTERFIIREIVSENTGVFNPLAVNTEKSINTARVTLFLLKVKSSGFTPLSVSEQGKEKTSLIMEYPLGSEWSHESSIKTNTERQFEQEFTPLRPVPGRHTPDYVYPSSMTPSEIKSQVIRKMQEIIESIYTGSEENCGMGSKTTGMIGAIVVELRYLNFEELRSLHSEMESILTRGEELKKVIGKQLFHDILASVGTNPSVTLMKEEIERGQISAKQLTKVVQTLLRDVRTPTQEILGDLVHLVKSLKNSENYGSSNIFYTGLNQLSTLFYRACVDASTSVSNYPVRIYGRFCTKDNSVLIEEYIPYLTSELERVESRGQRMAIISALGKTGHKKALVPITKAIEGHFSEKPIVRSLAVYSLRRICKQEPTLVKPVLLALIDNLAENTEVRIAAVSVLPYCQPSVAELQKIAIRSWFEPSKQVTSFLYSTLKGLTKTEVPELKPVGLRCKTVLSLVKPVQTGIQFSHNIHFVNFVNSLRMGGGIQTSMVKTAESLTPVRTALAFNLYGAGLWEIKRLDYTMYTQGMDAIVEKIISLVDGHEVSSEVESELRNIKEKLNIQTRSIIGSETPEIFTQFRMFDMERISHVQLKDIIEEVATTMRSQSGLGSESIRAVGAFVAINGEILMPTISGFPLYLQTLTPIVYGAKGCGRHNSGFSQLSGRSIGFKASPTANVQAITNIGVRCPLTQSFIGSGVQLNVHLSLPLEVKAELNSLNQVTVTIKTPEEVRGTIELFHAKVRAFTLIKDCKHITPVDETTNLKEIRTGKPVHKMTYPLGREAGLNAQLEVATDYKVYDFAYFYNLIREQGFASIQGLLPQSMKYFNTRLTFTPTESETKEIKIKFNLISGRNTESGIELVKSLGLEDIKIESSLASSGIKSEIERICREHFSTPQEIERCIEKHENVEENISLVETEKKEIEEICESIHLSGEEKEVCRKGLKVCHKAKVICKEAGIRSGYECSEKKDECISLKRSVESLRGVSRKLKSEIESVGSLGGKSLEGRVHGIAISTTLLKRTGAKKTANVVVVGGYSQKGQHIFTTTELICQTSQSPRYEVELRTSTRLPEVLYRWNLNALLEQPIEMKINADLLFGRAGEHKTKVSLATLWKKSETQRREVRSSPEYRKCEQEERESRPMSSVCMEVRHQAASVDEIRAEITYPKYMIENSPLVTKIANGLKSNILSNLVLFRTAGEEASSESGYGYERRVSFEVRVSRDGRSMDVTCRPENSETIVLKNIRLPELVHSVVPLSVRNGIIPRLVQKVTRDQAPASCTIDHAYVNSFDNRTYNYELNECEHLLFKDCSGLRPVAVTASKIGGNSKKVTILMGPHKVVLKPTTAIGGSVDIIVDGRIERISHNEEYTKRSPNTGNIVLSIYRNKDGVVSVENPVENVRVFCDNKRIEIVAPQRFHNRACGLCGDLNQENTADLKSPKQCIFSKDRFAAYSYILSQQCGVNQIRSEDKSLYEHERNQCIKSRSVITPVNMLARTLLESYPKPTTVKHIIHRETNRVCLSKKMTKVCHGSSRGGQTSEVIMPFACFTRPSSKAEQLVKRAEAGEVLPTVMTRPTMFSKKMTVTLSCGEEPYVPTNSMLEGSIRSENYRTGGRGY